MTNNGLTLKTAKAGGQSPPTKQQCEKAPVKKTVAKANIKRDNCSDGELYESRVEQFVSVLESSNSISKFEKSEDSTSNSQVSTNGEQAPMTSPNFNYLKSSGSSRQTMNVVDLTSSEETTKKSPTCLGSKNDNLHETMSQ